MIDARPRWPERIARAARSPTDAASLVAFRVLFGLIVAVGAIRFLAYGWVDRFFVEPAFHFSYWGFEWVRPWPGWGMHAHFVLIALLGLLVAAGLFYRVAIILLFVAFTYVELIDVTYYLNHYYLVSLLAFLLCFLPAHVSGSVDAVRRPHIRARAVPALALWVLRLQIGVVYFYAGLAKFGTDWLFEAQPLNIWLGSRTDFPIVGSWFGQPWVAYAFAWAGFLYDTTIPLWLSIRRTRLVAYVAVIGFHTMTGALFPIGMFPVIMTASALVFFPADWPRRVSGWFALKWRATSRLGRGALMRATSLAPLSTTSMSPGAEPRSGPISKRHRLVLSAAALFFVVQVLMPLRHLVYGGDVLWHEQGMRWSWKVMVREKNGAITFIVRSPSAGRIFHVNPRHYLTALQEREMSGQPDLILQLAHHIRTDFVEKGYADAVVTADALVSLNGRRAAPLIDPEVDLGRVQDGLLPAGWILPAPETEPPTLEPGALRLAELSAGTARSP